MNLLEKAKNVSVKNHATRDFTDEHLELVLAYLSGEITYKQMTVAAGVSPTGATNFVGGVLMWAIRNKKLQKV